MPAAARPLARLAVGWSALSELVPYYPLYALLFLDTGLSAAQVSGLFALWSLTGLVAEVPGGLLADRWSRRGAVVLGGLLQAVAFALWTAAPEPWAFAAGFAIWGVAGALVSGAAEALVHDALAALGAAPSYARVHGWMTSAELLVQVPTAVAAAALFAAGGYPAVGWASVAVCLAAAAIASRFPEARRDAADGGPPDPPGGLRVALRRPGLRLTVLAVALLGGLDAVEEYFPVLAGDWGVPTAAVPFAVLGASLSGALGGALAGRLEQLPDRALPGLLALAGVLVAGAAGLGGAAALLLVSAAYGVYVAVLVVGEARLQQRIDGRYRATVTSVAGVGVELAALPVFAAFALAGAGGVALVVLAVVPVVAVGLRAPARRSA